MTLHVTYTYECDLCRGQCYEPEVYRLSATTGGTTPFPHPRQMRIFDTWHVCSPCMNTHVRRLIEWKESDKK
jgi:hypothetical protein